MSNFRIIACIFYGLISVAQTLTSRYLFRSLRFNYYSTVFFLQRVIILLWGGTNNNFDAKILLYVLPYSLSACTVNILSSYCMTVMPLAAFMAFKKFVPVFAILIGFLMGIPNGLTKIQGYALMCVIIGGLLLGQKDILHGKIIGYVASIGYAMLQALGLQYSVLLSMKYGISPRDLMLANSIISAPYYFISLVYNKEYEGIFNYFTGDVSPFFFDVFLYTIPLSLASQYTANIISMRISAFDKASVSNIKDLVLTIISVKYFQDIVLTGLSQCGIIFCLLASIAFSVSLPSTPKMNALQSSEKEHWQAIQYQNDY